MHLFLMGFMGVGKSTVGRWLAQHTGRPLVELDAQVERLAGRPIPEIFSDQGEASFRQLETTALRQIEPEPPQIVATGGGVILREENRHILQHHGIAVWLTATPETLFYRLQSDYTRPLLSRELSVASVSELLAQRQPIYQQVAALTVPTDNQSVAQVGRHVLTLMQKKGWIDHEYL